MLRGIDEQPAPTTTDIQQTLPWLQTQLAAKVIQLLLLRLLKLVIRCGKVGAGVDHAGIQPERVEFVGAVVVIIGGLAIALFRVERATHFRCCVTWARLTHLRQTQQAFRKTHLFHLSPGPLQEVFHQWKKSFDIPFDVEVVVNIRLTQAQIAGRHEHLAQRAWVLEYQRAAC